MRKNADTYVPHEELGSTTTTTSSTLSSLNPPDAKDLSSPIFSPDVSSDQKLLLETDCDDNGDGNIHKLPSLPKLKSRAARGEDTMHEFFPVTRSSSTRDFRTSRRRDRLLVQIDDETAKDDM